MTSKKFGDAFEASGWNKLILTWLSFGLNKKNPKSKILII